MAREIWLHLRFHIFVIAVINGVLLILVHFTPFREKIRFLQAEVEELGYFVIGKLIADYLSDFLTLQRDFLRILIRQGFLLFGILLNRLLRRFFITLFSRFRSFIV